MYDYSYNGQARTPGFLPLRRIGIIPYGWGYFPGKQCLVKKIYAVDTARDKYAVYTKDRKEFRRLKERFMKLKNDYADRHEEIEKKYQEILNNVTCIQFWNEYLKEGHGQNVKAEN